MTDWSNTGPSDSASFQNAIKPDLIDRKQCDCVLNPALRLNHFFAGLLMLLLRTLVLALVLAYALSFIDGLRTYGITPFVWPFSGFGQFQPRLAQELPAAPWVRAFDDFLFFYNCAFPVAGRLGSGIGMIAAGFWTLHLTDPSCRLQRIGLAAVAGAIIGFRLTLMLTSSAITVFSATILSAIAFTFYMSSADKKPGIPSLPLIPWESGLPAGTKKG